MEIEPVTPDFIPPPGQPVRSESPEPLPPEEDVSEEEVQDEEVGDNVDLMA